MAAGAVKEKKKKDHGVDGGKRGQMEPLARRKNS